MSNPRRTSPVTRPAGAPSLKTNLVLRKGATFHSDTTPSTPETDATFFPPVPPLHRSQTSLDDVIDSYRRRTALTLVDIDKALAAHTAETPSPLTRSFPDEGIPVPRGILDHTVDSSIMSLKSDIDRRALHPRNRRPARHESDSGLGTSIVTADEKNISPPVKKDRSSLRTPAITRSAAGRSTTHLPPLSARSTNRIYEHTLKPILAKSSLKDFHPLVLECPRKIQEKEIVCLRDVEKTLLLLAPTKAKSVDLYLRFCLTTIRCIQATVEYLGEQEQTRPRDLPYTSGYFIDLVDQIQRYAHQLANAKEKGDQSENMDIDPSDEVKLHGGLHINGRPAELVRVKKDGRLISMATGETLNATDPETKGSVRFKRSASEELEDEEEIMRSMGRRKKNPSPEELAPKKCREPGCNKEFKRPCDLTKHEKTHSRPWKCPEPTCKYHEYGWPTEKEMDRHHNDKHSSNPPMFECLFKPCTYKSKRDSNRKQHMEKAHGWTYVRTKSNLKKSGSPSVQGSTAEPTPQLQNLPTPPSEHSVGAATPTDDHFGAFYGGGINNESDNMDLSTFMSNDGSLDMMAQDMKFDYSSPEDATPSTDSGLDFNPSYQDIGNDFTLFEDIYSANAQISPPLQSPYQKQFPEQLAAFADPGLYQPQLTPHFSPTGQAGAMLYTPASLADVDEGFDERRDMWGAEKGFSSGDFILFPDSSASKAMCNDSLFDIPSLAVGFSQANPQDFLEGYPMDWQSTDFRNFSQ